MSEYKFGDCRFEQTTDRDQIRQRAERHLEWHGRVPASWLRAQAKDCLDLLDELEQAERVRDAAIGHLYDQSVHDA